MTFERVQSKLDLLRANLEQLDRIPQGSFDEWRGDFRNVQATLHLLQTSIQALIDIGAFLVVQRALPTPSTSLAVLDVLEGAGCIPPGTSAKYAPVVGFRNRVVHLYERIDERRVFDVLTQHRQDLATLLDLLLAAGGA